VQRVLASPDCDPANNRTAQELSGPRDGSVSGQSVPGGRRRVDVQKEVRIKRVCSSTSPSPWELAGRFVGSPETSAVGSGVPLAIYGSYTTLKALVDIVSRNIDPERYSSHSARARRTSGQGRIRSLGASGIRVAGKR